MLGLSSLLLFFLAVLQLIRRRRLSIWCVLDVFVRQYRVQSFPSQSHRMEVFECREFGFWFGVREPERHLLVGLWWGPVGQLVGRE